jgi:hypothetical protein
VAVLGRSGSGKSSIVYAGLMPALRRERGVSGDSVWQILNLRPYAEPLHQLAQTFDPPKAEPGSIDFRTAANREPSRFETGNLDALAWHLAVRFAMPLTKDPKVRADAFPLATQAQALAETEDANEVQEWSDIESDMVEERDV